jgi:hypothetical protein
MRYLLDKSWPVCLVYFLMSFLITLSFSNFIAVYKMTDSYPDGLTKNYITFDVLWSNDGFSDLLSLIESLDSTNKPYTLYRTSPFGVAGVFCKNTVPDVDLVSGRNFEEKDFYESTNSILISEEMQAKCDVVNGKTMFVYSGDRYEVIGVYKRTSNRLTQDAYAIYNLISEHVLKGDRYINGRYHLDIGGYNIEALDQMKEICSFDLLRSTRENAFWERLKRTVRIQGMTSGVFLLVLLMIFLNSASVISSWIEKRRKEIFIRKICGASVSAVNLKIFQDYLSLVFLSFVSGFCAAYLAAKWTGGIAVQMIGGFDFSAAVVLTSFVPVLCLGVITITAMLFYYHHRRNLTGMTRW